MSPDSTAATPERKPDQFWVWDSGEGPLALYRLRWPGDGLYVDRYDPATSSWHDWPPGYDRYLRRIGIGSGDLERVDDAAVPAIKAALLADAGA